MRKLYFTFLMIFVSALPVHASEGLSDIAQKAETYLQNLSTAKARFIQTAPDGSQIAGTFYISRPGKLRFEYDDPIEDFIVADGLFIYFYDSELGEQTNAPIGQTLADFFLRSDPELDGDVTVKDAVNNEQAGLDLITLVQSDDEDAGTLTLGFTQEPYDLKKWRVVDGQGLMTEIELFELEKDLEFERSLFVYADPKKFEQSFNE